MNTRDKKIINAVIKEYVKKADPVGSEELCDAYDFGLSSATIRVIMKRLEKQGYLWKPHTSAGRIPTDKAYRFFVDNLPEKQLAKREQNILKAELLKTRAEYNRLAKASAKILARLSHALAMNVFDEGERFYEAGAADIFKNPEFKEAENIAELMEVMDGFLDGLCKLEEDELFDSKVWIGGENPFKAEGLSLISKCYRLPSGKKGILALIGPKRMLYERNISLVDYVAKILGEEI